MVGLTGTIASGKSSALKAFASLGWFPISSDSIVGELLESDPEVRDSIRARWGELGFQPSGRIDKQAIAGLVFGDPSERRWLESLLHPLVRSRWLSMVQSCNSEKCMVELPLLFENNLQMHFTYTISVYSPDEAIRERLLRRGYSRDHSRARMRSQSSQEEKAARADFVLWGGGTHDFLHHQARETEACSLT